MAWKRQDQGGDSQFGRYNPDPPVEAVHQPGSQSQAAAQIGKTITIKGEIHSDEDLVVNGTVEGQVFIKKHRLTVGTTGKIQADVKARWVILSGEVKGSITAGDRLELTSSGRVYGDVNAPRLIIAEGATLQGAVDTDPTKANQQGRQQDQRDQHRKDQRQAQVQGKNGQPQGHGQKKQQNATQGSSQ